MKRFFFFPYNDDKNFSLLHEGCRKNDVVIFCFPGTRQEWVKCLQQKGVQVLAYVSIYKIPVMSELDDGRGFAGGSVSREEVECNPYWKSIAIEETHEQEGFEKVSISETGERIRPFRRQQYKKGWYQTCLHSERLEEQIVRGIDGLFTSIGIDGLFVDNIVSRLDSCIHCKGENDDLLKKRRTILSGIYQRVKYTLRDKLILLNTGRKLLFNPEIPADMYVSENFCFTDTLSPQSCYTFAGKTYDDEQAMYIDIMEVEEKLKGENIVLLAYTKVNGKLPFRVLQERLRKAYEVAEKFRIPLTFRITSVSTDKKKEILFGLKGLNEYGL